MVRTISIFKCKYQGNFIICNSFFRDDPIYDDIQLLRAEIERCRVILSELDVVRGRRAIAEEPPVPVTLLVDEVLYQLLGSDAINFVVTNSGTGDLDIPLVKHHPEWLHALENLLQNAKQFAVREVNIHIDWVSDDIRIELWDDGPGFSASTLAQAGQPRNTSGGVKGGHRGRGVVSARRLLEAIGGSVQFGNAAGGGGLVELRVPRSAL